VVWVQPTYGQPQNVGVVTVDKDLEGTLNTVTPHKQFKVMITPEANGQVTSPSNAPVFTSEVAR